MFFQFKEFTIEQDRCAMKIGTDGVLLGAWTSLDNNPFSVLDIGTGTGIIALMIAQRSSAEQIDALEIDENAYEQAVENFENSLWADRLFCYHAALDEFTEEMDEEYDLIVSNPPFYTEDYLSNTKARDLARFAMAMPFDELIEAVSVLLSEEGLFSVIIPFKEETNFITTAISFKLYPSKITRVKGNPDAEIKRSLLSFTRTQNEGYPVNELIIETTRHQYTPEYTELTKDFYLKM